MRHRIKGSFPDTGSKLVLHNESSFQHLSRLSARSVDDLELQCLCTTLSIGDNIEDQLDYFQAVDILGRC